jgi:hypothetical protein
MNEHDFQNLRFLLLSSPEVLADWYENVDEDDHDYAIELLEAASMREVIRILEEKEQIMLEEGKFELTEAQEYLSKFTLGGVQ